MMVEALLLYYYKAEQIYDILQTNIFDAFFSLVADILQTIIFDAFCIFSCWYFGTMQNKAREW